MAQHTKGGLLLLISFLSAVLLVTPPAAAQTFEKGAISGTVFDPSDAVVPGATVTITNVATGAQRSLETDSDGRYRAAVLPAGEYRIEATGSGFATSIVRNVRLAVGQELIQDVKLELAGVVETLEVTGEAPLIETSEALEKVVLDQNYVEQLPISGRDFRDFVLLSGTADDSPGLRSPIRLGGQLGQYTGFVIDGVDNRNSFFGEWFGSLETKNFTIPQDSIQEFQVRDGGFGAEFGHATGGLINVVTKSGTNDWHGTAHWFFQSNTFIRNTSVPEGPTAGETIPPSLDTRHQFGGTVGGPIKQDKMFIFFALEAQQQKGPLTAAFSRNVSAAPCPCPLDDMPDLSGQTLASLEGGVGQRQDLFAPLVKFDWHVTPNNTATTKLNYTRNETDSFTGFAGSQTFVSGAVGNNFEDFVNEGWAFSQTLTTVINPLTVNEFRFAVSREMRPRRQKGPAPGVIIFDSGAFNQALFLPIDSDHKRFQFLDNFSRTFGKHDVKLGVDLNSNVSDQIFIGFDGGEYFFASLEDFQARTPLFLLNLVGINGFSSTESGTVPPFWQHELSFYVQDNWRIHPRVTLNLGLRWDGVWNPHPEFSPFPPNAANILVPVGEPRIVGGVVQQDLEPIPQDIPDDFNNWAPRFGAAWDVTGEGRTIVRGGVGLYYAPMPTIFMADMLSGIGARGAVAFIPFFGSPTDLLGLGLSFPDTLPDIASPAVQAALGPPGIRYADPDLESARTLNLQLGVEHEIVRDLSISGTYLYIRTENLRTGGFFSTRWDRNLDPTGVSFDQFGRTINAFNQSRISSEISFADTLASFGKARYHAFILQVKKALSNRYQFGINYTASRNSDNATSDRDTDAFSGPSDPWNFQALDFGRGQLDIRHQFRAYAVVEAPWAIQISTIISARSGRAFPVYDHGCNVVIIEYATSDQCSGPSNNFSTVRPVVDGRLLGRYPFRNGDVVNWDLRFGREFPLTTERARLRVTFEIFNVTDAGNFFSAPQAGTNAVRNVDDGTGTLIPNSAFRQRDQTLGPVAAQFGLKFIF